MDSNAWEELQTYLEPDEALESIVFGAWGWGSLDEEDFSPGYGEREALPVPVEKRGVLLSPSEAEPLMQSWCFYGGFGAPECYATYAWTNKRVIWVTQYDGSTSLSSAPRNPCDTIPEMPGG